MDQHWELEITLREHPGNLDQMVSDRFLAGRIVRVVCLYFNSTSILKKQKVVRGHFVAEAHC